MWVRRARARVGGPRGCAGRADRVGRGPSVWTWRLEEGTDGAPSVGGRAGHVNGVLARARQWRN